MTRRVHRAAWILGPVAIALLALPSASTSQAAGEPPKLGQQGIVTGLPATDSAVTIKGRDRFANMEFKVNQTKGLNSQVVSLSWTGGIETAQGITPVGEHFVQVMQCWGDDDGTNPANPGPPPEQCQYGATSGVDGFSPGQNYPAADATARVIGARFYPSFDASLGPVDSSGVQWRSFRAVNGEVIDGHLNRSYNPAIESSSLWLNSYFNSITTNEIPNGRTLASGTGTALFQVDTGPFSPGLGCGQKTQPQPDGSKKVPKCWLVIVPRGSAVDEYNPRESGTAQKNGVSNSPLAPSAWTNRIAIPLEFNPVDSPCSIADTERRIVGSDVPLLAVASWQPTLCTTPGLPPYAYSPVGDPAARQQVAASKPGSPGMAVVSSPFESNQLDPASPPVYAPVSLSGVVIGVNFERSIRPSTPEYPYALDEIRALQSTRISTVNLTPRIVAKLLTQSYRSQVEIGSSTPPYPWDNTNPVDILEDPDFLAFNPEFGYFFRDRRLMGSLHISSGASDAAKLVWEWIAADPEARAWLDGTPDAWGMKVNPVYSTSPTLNPTGQSFLDPTPSAYPKSDPYCYQAPRYTGTNQPFMPPLLCGTDWRPYAQNALQVATQIAQGTDGARIYERSFPAGSSSYWTRDPFAAPVGGRTMAGITDAGSAARYGLQAARLSRAGDNAASRSFVGPNASSLTAAVSSMQDAGNGFLRPALTSQPASAYPLTLLTYAALKPLSLDEQARREYAAFIEYAAGPGQTPGSKFGQLPIGFVPLPPAQQAQAKAAAETVRTLQPVTTTTTTTTTTTIGTGTGTGGGTSSVVTVPRPSRPSATVTTLPAVTTSSIDGGAVDESTTTTSTTVPTSTTEPAGTTTTAVRGSTPSTGRAASQFAVALVGAVGLMSALAVLQITKRPRKVASAALAGASGQVEMIEVLDTGGAS